MSLTSFRIEPEKAQTGIRNTTLKRVLERKSGAKENLEKLDEVRSKVGSELVNKINTFPMVVVYVRKQKAEIKCNRNMDLATLFNNSFEISMYIRKK